jgi:molecular chaperone DnaJ
VLSDADKRAAYDRYGHAGLGAQGLAAKSVCRRRGHRRHLRRLVRRDVQWAAQRQRASRQQRGDDLRFDLAIDFEDAVFGTETEVKIRRLETCAACQGRGSASGRGPTLCSQCQGRGQIRYQQGFFSVARTCGACGGAGSVIGDPCRHAVAKAAPPLKSS